MRTPGRHAAAGPRECGCPVLLYLAAGVGALVSTLGMLLRMAGVA